MRTITIVRLDTACDAPVETILADHHDLNDADLLVQILVDLGVIQDGQAERPSVKRLTQQIRVLLFTCGDKILEYKITELDGRRMARCLIESMVEKQAVVRDGTDRPYFIEYQTGSGETQTDRGIRIELRADSLPGLVDLIEALQP